MGSIGDAYDNAMAEGKSTGEIARILKRYVAREVYKHLPHPC